jgi:protocatechuate 3,4-dioxygenase beta subunit
MKRERRTLLRESTIMNVSFDPFGRPGPLRRLSATLAVVALVVLSPVPSRAQAPGRGSSARMTVSGRVLDPAGKPVPNASVMVHARSAALAGRYTVERFFPTEIGRATSDGAGRFRVEVPRTWWSHDDQFGAVALAPGYGVGWAALDADADLPTAEITLRPEQVIHGRLFDLQGQPAHNVKLSVDAIRRVFHPGRNPAREEFEGPAFLWTHPDDLAGWPRPVTTGADGRFTVHGVGPGLRVYLSVHDSRFAHQRIEVESGAPSQTQPLTIALQPARTITGRVTQADTGRPIPQARVIISGFDQYQLGAGPGPIPAETDAEGRFRAPAGSGARGGVAAMPPAGTPYLPAQQPIDWPKGAIVHAVDLALPRGATIQGKVIEQGSGQPVTGAVVMGYPHAMPNDTVSRSGLVETADDGSFQLAISPYPGYLVVRVPSDDYVLQEIGRNLFLDGQPGGQRLYAHAFIAYDLKPGGEIRDMRIVLRRGVTVLGQVVGPDGQPGQDAWLFSRIHLGPGLRLWQFWNGGRHGTARGGRFVLRGLDPNAETLIHVLEPKSKLGATVRVSGKSPNSEPVTVRLQPCGTATARVVDPDGKPIGGFRLPRLISMVITPGPVARPRPRQEKALFADEDALSVIDPINYENHPVSDSQGRMVFPALIPGAAYRIVDATRIREGVGPQVRREFTVQAGEMLDLGEIRIEKPQSLLR